MLRGGLEILTRSFTMLRRSLNCLKQALAAYSEFSEKIARETVEREIAQREATEARCYLATVKVELARVAAESAQLKKMIEERDEKLSSSTTELATLQAAKDEVETKLDRNFEETEELLKRNFLRDVRQADVLYGGPAGL